MFEPAAGDINTDSVVILHQKQERVHPTERVRGFPKSYLLIFDHLFNQFLHLLVMRPFPVDLSAGGAQLKFIEIQLGQWLQAVKDSFLCHRLQGMVTTQTTMERSDSGGEIETPDHFAQLLERVEGPETIAMHDRLSHEQTPVAAEKD